MKTLLELQRSYDQQTESLLELVEKLLPLAVAKAMGSGPEIVNLYKVCADRADLRRQITAHKQEMELKRGNKSPIR